MWFLKMNLFIPSNKLMPSFYPPSPPIKIIGKLVEQTAGPLLTASHRPSLADQKP